MVQAANMVQLDLLFCHEDNPSGRDYGQDAMSHFNVLTGLTTGANPGRKFWGAKPIFGG